MRDPESLPLVRSRARGAMIQESPPGRPTLSSPRCRPTVKARLWFVCTFFDLIRRVTMATLKRAHGLPVAEVFIELETETGELAGRHFNTHGHIQAIQKHKQAVGRSERVDRSV